MGQKKLSKEQEIQLIEDYKAGASCVSLMKKYGFATKKSITDKIKKYYKEDYSSIIKEAQQNRKGYSYSLEKISSEFDAYFLGLLLTDGYVSREREIGLDLVDEDCISFLSKAIGKNYKTYEPTISNNPLIQGKQKHHRLILSDAALINDIARFGVIPNKTNILPEPRLLPEEEKYIPYIIRGIIDGDGCIFETSYGSPAFYIITKSEKFSKWLLDILTNKLFMIDIRYYKTKDGLYKVETANQDNILKLIVLCYNKPFGMNRKYSHLRKMFRDYNNELLLGERYSPDHNK